MGWTISERGAKANSQLIRVVFSTTISSCLINCELIRQLMLMKRCLKDIPLIKIPQVSIRPVSKKVVTKGCQLLLTLYLFFFLPLMLVISSFPLLYRGFLLSLQGAIENAQAKAKNRQRAPKADGMNLVCRCNATLIIKPLKRSLFFLQRKQKLMKTNQRNHEKA